MDTLGKHELEKEFFHSLRYFEPDAKFGSVNKSECPDFLVAGKDKVLGVEVTALYVSQEEVAVESTKSAITSSAQAEAKRLGLASANVMLFFSITHPLIAKKRSEIAVRVTQVVEQYMPLLGEQTSLEGVAGQPPEVDLIMIDRNAPRRERWDWMEAGIVLKNSHQLLQNAIDKKAPKLPQYLKKCDECWLLIGVNSFRPSGKIRPRNIETTTVYSPFHRTYFLDYGRGDLTRLRYG